MERGACGGDCGDYAIEGRFRAEAAAEDASTEETSSGVAASGVRRIGLWDFSDGPRYLGYITAEGPTDSFFFRAGYLVKTDETEETTVSFRRSAYSTGIVLHAANTETPVEAKINLPEARMLHSQVACPKVKRGVDPIVCVKCPYWENGAGLWSCMYRQRTKNMQ